MSEYRELVELMKKSNPSGNLATSLFKALDLLTLLAVKKEGLPIAELVDQMDLPRSSVIRMLDSLDHYGLVSRDELKRYLVTEKFREWRAEDPDERLRMKYRLLMQQITEEVGEMTVLGRLQGRKIRHIHFEEPDRRVRVTPPVGRKFETKSLAMGKLILGQRFDLLPDDLSEQQLQEIDQARINGFAWNRSDSEPDIVAWATWLGEPSGLTPMLAITWAEFRFEEALLEKAKQIIQEFLAKEG